MNFSTKYAKDFLLSLNQSDLVLRNYYKLDAELIRREKAGVDKSSAYEQINFNDHLSFINNTELELQIKDAKNKLDVIHKKINNHEFMKWLDFHEAMLRNILKQANKKRS